MPIPVIDPDDWTKLVSTVDRILSAKRRDPRADTVALEREIDYLFYELYDLNPEEITCVEESANA